MQKVDTEASEILFVGQLSPTQARALNRRLDAGEFRRIYQGVYTANLHSPLEAVVLRNWTAIVGYLLPDGVLALRSALEHRPVGGVLYISRGQRRRSIELPGLTLKVLPERPAITDGPAPDIASRGVHFPSEERGLLENLSRTRGDEARTLSQQEIEARLDKILTIRGDFKLNDLRDRARVVAEKLSMQREFARLDGIVGALLGTHEEKKLRSKQALARAAGRPYDPDRIELFDVLHATLVEHIFNPLDDPASSGMALENFAFFEAYFSNFIEGTTFEIDEAEQIIFEGLVIPNRSEDSHDILGTFQAATSAQWRVRPPEDAGQFLNWLKTVNALVMQARPDKNPGQWKEKANQAGNSLFVLPELVAGTLREGFTRIAALHDPVARALMTMFVVTEVHPFRDGNGRTARLAMNCVLSAAGVCRIIIPTVYREDYLLPLKRLSHTKEAEPYIRSMIRALNWTASFDYAQSREHLKQTLKNCNAFEEDLKNFRLTFPEPSSH
ncbi:cell filamentation protein Fic [Paraburkholderia sp. Ac-20340]|uniref:Fic family protein n=1 Tax=Paraburkholderia sp. Ac-20340 TaxID=2703888 RepID=UPI00197E488C|nr:Fic family protein [Paraburkholderia sp. Ac-20340]MBN3853544.1 cell filamentation protein Fic [Paraburkholderia sp. Ac-20340]